jgi:hypothetical protein
LAFRGKVSNLAACEGQAIEAAVLPAHRACPPRHITPDLIGEQPDNVADQRLNQSDREWRCFNRSVAE